MRIFGWVVVGLAACGPSEEECTGAVPTSAVVLADGGLLQDANGSSVYVCPGATVEINAANQSVFVGAGAVVDFSGADSTVWADAGSSVALGGAGTSAYVEQDVVVDSKAIDQDVVVCRDVILTGAPTCP